MTRDAATTKVSGALGVAIARLRRAPSRTLLVVFAVALAVLSTTLLASVGFGVMASGEERFEAAAGGLWITGGPIELQPSASTPFENAIVGAHTVSERAERVEGVRGAPPIAFEAVYVGTNASDLKLLTAVGVEATPPSADVQAGRVLTGADTHYANGSYEGPMTRNVLIDSRTAALFDVSVGDTLYVGGSRANARNHPFRVVGVSPTYTRFLATPTVAMHLSELQEVKGTTATDRATLISVDLEPGADPRAVADRLERSFPQYEIRTSREQLQSIVRDNAVLYVSAAALVVLAVLVGLALTVNLLTLVVYGQRYEVAALRAIGLSRPLLVGMVAAQGLLLGLVGGALGLLATPPIVFGLNYAISASIGVESLLRTPMLVYAIGAATAVGIGTAAAAAAGWQLLRLPPITDLSR